MKRLTRNHSIFAMDKKNQPVLYVDSGESFIVETEDCFCHKIVESDDVLCVSPGPHGGNLDTVNIAGGAEIYLPVFTSGAKLALGDVHAIMGDGEICGTGVEIRAEVEMKVEICENWQLSNPVVKTEESYFFIGSAKTIEEAIQMTS